MARRGAVSLSEIVPVMTPVVMLSSRSWQVGGRHLLDAAPADLGYETIWAVSAADALKLLATVEGFDVLFSNVIRRGMNGIEFGQEIRRRSPGLLPARG